MKISGYLLIAVRLALSRRGANLISAVAVTALSLLPLVAAMEIADGMTHGIITRYLETGSYHFRAVPLSGTATKEQVEQIEQKLHLNPNVLTVTGEKQAFAMAFSPFGRSGVLLRGFGPDFYAPDPILRRYLTFSYGEAVLDDQNVLIGESLASSLNLGVGETLRLLTIGKDSRIPVIRGFNVGGIFSVGYHDLDKSWVLINQEQRIFFEDSGGSQFFLGIKVKDPFGDPKNQKQILQELLPEDWFIIDWQDINYAMIENFRTTRLMLFFVLGLAVCVAIVSNGGALQIFFLSRRKETALLRAMGAAPADVRRIFLWLGLTVGFFGALCGVLLGVITALNINGIILFLEKTGNVLDALFHGQTNALGRETFYLEQIPIRINILRLSLIILFVVIWSALVNFGPAKKIARSRVLSILRKI